MEIGNLKKFLLVPLLLYIGITLFYLSSYANSGEEFRLPTPIGPHHPLTIHTNGGRLGNQMFTYATLMGLCNLNARPMKIKPHNYKVLSEYFDIVTPIINEKTFIESNPWLIENWLSENDSHIPMTTNIIKGTSYPTSYTFFDHIRQEVRDVFQFKPSYRKHAQDVLWKIKKLKPNTQVYVGIHVRRGDYLKHSSGGWLRAWDGREVDMEFFEKALQHFTDKFNNVTFLAVSDDRTWCRTKLSHLGILTTPDSPSAGHDLALLSQCNHTIMTYGTYGFWGGYLAAGEVVYFADYLRPNSSFLRDYFIYEKMYLPEWTGISTTKPGFWESYTNTFLT